MDEGTTIARAYGLLWLYGGTDQHIHEARKLLLSLLTPDGQRRGIASAREANLQVLKEATKAEESFMARTTVEGCRRISILDRDRRRLIPLSEHHPSQGTKTMAKQKRATEQLNVELSRISSAITIIEDAAAELPDGCRDQKAAILRMIQEAKRGHEAAFGHLQTISLHASMI